METYLQILLFFLALLGGILVLVCVYCSIEQERRYKKNRKKKQIQDTIEESRRHYDESDRSSESYTINVENIPDDLKIPKIVPKYYSENNEISPYDDFPYRKKREQPSRPNPRPVRRYNTMPDYPHSKSVENVNRIDGFYYHNKFHYSPQAPLGQAPLKSQSTNSLKHWEQYPTYYNQRLWETHFSSDRGQYPPPVSGRKSQSTYDLRNWEQYPFSVRNQVEPQSFNERRSRSTNDLRHSDRSPSNLRKQQSFNEKKKQSKKDQIPWDKVGNVAKKQAINILKNQLTDGDEDQSPVMKNIKRARESFKMLKSVKDRLEDD